MNEIPKGAHGLFVYYGADGRPVELKLSAKEYVAVYELLKEIRGKQ